MEWRSHHSPSKGSFTPGTTWRARLRRRIGEELTGDEARAFAEETAERDIRRMRVFASLMIVLHVGHILLLRVSDSERVTLPADTARWYDLLVLVHAATLPLAVLITLVAYFWPRSLLGRVILPFAAVGYLVHGALITGVDQIVLGNVAALTGYSFGVAVICGFPLRTALWVYGIGALTAVLTIFEFQQDPATRMSNLLNVATLMTMCIGLTTLLFGARQRDFRQRRLIAQQRDELANLNADLERRVNEQVGEILRRAEEIGQLNAQLRSQIRKRSSELSAALARLAEQRDKEGMLTGFMLGDRFEIGETLGSGGMGVVYRGLDRITGAHVAIKVIRSSSVVELDAMRRFLDEASAVATITHPAVVRMVHVDVTDDGLLYQAQELIEGKTLETIMEDRVWPEAEAVRLCSVLCEALAAAHSQGVIHRDVKPANIMLVDKTPGLKLLDFGLAKLFDEVSRVGTADGRTGVGLVVGTPAYMAPEQVLAKDVTEKADVYAVGVLLFQLLTGRLAFETDGTSRIMLKHVSDDAPSLRDIKLDADEELARMVAACLAKDPGERPSASDLGAWLTGFADERGVAALEELVRRMAEKPPSGNPARSVTRSIARRLNLGA